MTLENKTIRVHNKLYQVGILKNVTFYLITRFLCFRREIGASIVIIKETRNGRIDINYLGTGCLILKDGILNGSEGQKDQ
jgi:hypothetical protein